jgi:hypothetical protein
LILSVGCALVDHVLLRDQLSFILSYILMLCQRVGVEVG